MGECCWVDAPAADPVHVPAQPARLEDDEALGLPRQRGLDELRSLEGVEG